MFAGEGGVGEHRVFRRDPTAGDILFLHPTRDGFLDHGGADDFRVSEGNQNRALGVRGDGFFDGDRADLARLAVVVSAHRGTLRDGRGGGKDGVL